MALLPEACLSLANLRSFAADGEGPGSPLRLGPRLLEHQGRAGRSFPGRPTAGCEALPQGAMCRPCSTSAKPIARCVGDDDLRSDAGDGEDFAVHERDGMDPDIAEEDLDIDEFDDL
mmetsp:Transcript_126090/g.392533  ORF Transcript_126090/g.392533 Transcript_126090/m.392533 type:complete len:117 (-) Transcript_126090:105-455(-)